MIKEVKSLGLFPFVLFLLFSLMFFFIFYTFLQEYFKKEINQSQNRILNLEKKYLKKEVNNFKYTFNLFFEISYNETYSNLKIFLKTMIEKNIINDLYISKDNNFIIGKIPKNKKLYYKIYKKKYIFLNLNDYTYLVYLINKNKNTYIAGINKNYIDNLIFKEIRKYLNKINKNDEGYIALGKITTFNPDKNGVFGYIYYMPPKLKEKEGLRLSIYKPDVNGGYFRKEYFNCLKENKSCFIKYFFKNPKTGKVEEKISYFSLIKPFNFVVVKGIYASDIYKKVYQEIKIREKELKNILLFGIFIYLLIMIVYFIILWFLVQKMQVKILQEYKELIDKLEYKHYYDSLTNLPNRIKLIEELEIYESLILMDIDDFYDINDVYGYELGNKILKKIAYELKNEYQNVYRTGSDEFVIGLKRKVNKFDLCKIANREYKYELIKLTLTVSGSNKKDVLLKTAESALKVAKKNKINCILFNEEMEKVQRERIETIQKLRDALKNKKIIPFYQCIVGKENKYEALMRVEIDNKIIPPFMFMNLLKEAKLYHKFSQIMIEKVFNDVENGKIENVSINLSFIDIVEEETREFIFNLINKCKKNNLITFEILEEESIENFNLIKDFINKVKTQGIKIAIDDFGSGYSNFVRILELRPDFIKIDGSLVKNVKNEKYFEIIRLIVEFANKFNISTVAEFVENKEIYDILKNMGVEYFQGYYFCKPQSLENIKITLC